MAFDPTTAKRVFDPTSARKVQEQPDPVDVLSMDPLQGMEHELAALVRDTLGPDELEMMTAKAYHDQKFGMNHPPELVQAHIEYEYGKGATAKTANAQNKRAGFKEFAGTAIGGLFDITGEATKAAGDLFQGLIGRFAFRTPPDEFKPSKKMVDKAGSVEAAKETYRKAYEWHNKMRGTSEFKEKVSEMYSGFAEGIEQTKPEWVRQSKEIVEAELSGGDMGFLKQGVAMVALNAPNLFTSGNVFIGYPMMYARERSSMDDQLKNAGLDVDVREEYSRTYGAISGMIEYVENLGRVRSAFGGNAKKKVRGKIISTVLKKASNGAINVGEEVAQELLSNIIYNQAIDAHFEKTGERLQRKAIPEGIDEAALGSLSMTVVLEALGLSVKGVDVARQKAMTLGDANRMRKQNTDDEISTMEADGTLTPEEAAVVRNPTEETYSEYLSAEEQKMNEELQALTQKIEGQQEQPSERKGAGQKESLPAKEKDNANLAPYASAYPNAEFSLDKAEVRQVKGMLGPERGLVIPAEYDRVIKVNKNNKKAIDDAGGNIIGTDGNDVVLLKRQKENLTPRTYEGITGKPFPYSESTFFFGTEADFKPVDVPLRDPDFESNSGSKYWYTKDGVIRFSDHWGAVASASWHLPSGSAGFAKWGDFRTKGSHLNSLRQHVLGDQSDIITPETAKPGDIVGISRESNNEFRAMLGATELDETAREKQTETLRKAIDEGIVDDADMLAAEINATPRELKAEEVAGLLARKAQLSNEIEILQGKISEAEASGDMNAVNRAMARLDETTQTALSLTTAVTQGAAKNARALAAMAMHMDRKTFSLVNVVSEAVKAKGDALTESERTELAEMTRSLQETEARIKQLEADFDAKLEAEARKIAEDIIKTTLEQRTTVQRRTNAAKKREAGKETLKKLQWQVSDITGVPFKVASALRDIAVSHIMDGATTLDEVVKRVQKDVPDTRVTARVIYDSLGGRVKKEAKKAKSDAQKYVSELKKQARLQGEIADAMEGIFDPKRKTKPSSSEVSALKAKLKQYRDSFYKTEQEEAKIEAVEQRIERMEDMIERAYRPIKRVVKKSDALKAAEAKLKLKGKELSAQDRIALLEELLRSDVVQPMATKETSSETSVRLEQFRARIAVLEELRKRNKHEASIDARIDSLTREIETFTRDIRPKRKERSDYRADEIKELQREKRNQDIVVDLLETIRTRKVSESIAKTVTEDKSGYEAMKKNLREKMRKEAWYQDQMEARELEKVKIDIAELDRRLAEGDYEGFITPRQERVITNQELVYAKIQRNKKRREITRKINALKPKTKMDKALWLYEVPRSSKLAFDIGHIGRQGGYALSNWRKTNALKLSGRSVAAFFSEDMADIMDLWVEENQYRVDAEIDELHIIEDGQSLGERERVVITEGLFSDIADKNIIAKKYKEGLKASERTQRSSINFLRMFLYAGYRNRHPEATMEERKAAASYYNSITGYGTWKFVGDAARNSVIARLFTSVRFTGSRYQTATILFDPTKMKHKNLRNEMIEDALWFYGTRAVLLSALAAALPDEWVEIGTNPDHSTIGRVLIHMPNKQTLVIDLWAGVQRTMRVARAIQKGDKEYVQSLLGDIGKSQHVTIAAIRGVIEGKKYPNEDIGRIEAAIRGVAPIPAETLVDAVMEDTPAGYVALGVFMDIIGHSAYTVETSKLSGKTSFKDRNKD